MKDREFLMWIHERLEYVYHEKPTTDFMHHLRAIILATPADQNTVGARTGNSLQDIKVMLNEREN